MLKTIATQDANAIGAITTISGTPNQINVATSGTTVTLSTPTDFRPPGTVNAVSTITGTALIPSSNVVPTSGMYLVNSSTVGIAAQGVGQVQITGPATANRQVVLSGADSTEAAIKTTGGNLAISPGGLLSAQFGGVSGSGVFLIFTGAAPGASPSFSTSDQNLILMTGAALSTGSTTGMVLIPAMSGTPTGAPTSAGAGAIPMVYDTANNKIWFYNGSWRGVAVT